MIIVPMFAVMTIVVMMVVITARAMATVEVVIVMNTFVEGDDNNSCDYVGEYGD